MLKYTFDKNKILIEEKPTEKDVEFEIKLLQVEPYSEHLKQIRDYFEDNDVHTDVLYYANANHEYKIIVRHDYYADFILQLMKHHLLESVEWTS